MQDGAFIFAADIRAKNDIKSYAKIIIVGDIDTCIRVIRRYASYFKRDVHSGSNASAVLKNPLHLPHTGKHYTIGASWPSAPLRMAREETK